MRALVLGCLLLALAPALAAAQEPAAQPQPELAMTDTARGTFTVQLVPQPTDAAPLGRMSIDKTFAGDLVGTSRGEMLAFRSEVEGSAGYVAMERVTGALRGRRGTFVLQHSGTMNRGAQQLELTVVPDSGTGELAGLSGSMQIIIEDGGHAYVFVYRM